jgi:hypothetical protein
VLTAPVEAVQPVPVVRELLVRELAVRELTGSSRRAEPLGP